MNNNTGANSSATSQNGSVPTELGSNELRSSFLDPGVSNGDVDWLFRGREIKKLTKRTNTINTEVQSQLLQAQHKALLESKGKESGANSPVANGSLLNESLSSATNLKSLNDQSFEHQASSPSVSIPQKVPDAPLKSSLKPSSVSSSSTLKLDTSSVVGSPVSSSLGSHKSLSLAMENNNVANVGTPAHSASQSPVSTPANRSRSSSLFGKARSPSVANESKPKKSFISTLSSKIKSSTSSSASIASPVATSNKTVPIARREYAKPTVPNTSNTEAQQASIHEQKETNLLDKELGPVSFKRVCFALNELIEDPQQQIPSRRPKRGNVLIPEDMMAPPPKLSIGITNSFNEQTKDQKPNVDPQIYEEAVARHRYFLAESKKHSEEAHIAALRMAKEVAAFKKRKGSFLKGIDSDEDEEDEENITDSRFLSNGDDVLDIDTPLHQHVNYFGNVEEAADSQIEDPNTDISLETLYTRCCHLREILPIPATLKQLKDKTKPLHVLKMLNPRPTLIDILSFSDFLAVAPIITVIFDNVTIDTEMLKIVLVSLKNSKMLEKLSMRNVPIDQEGWKYLCKFLKENKVIEKLDISQQRVKKSSDSNKSVLRSDLNWDLFTETLAERGGLEELVIHGCSLNPSQFTNLVNKALTLKTKRLGLASSQLDIVKMNVLSKWISSPKSTCIGIDFAFNDLSLGQLKCLNSDLKANGSQIQLQFFSLNSTNVQLDECSELIKNLSTLPSLRFLDLSNNPHLFPDILPVLRENLPNYPDLRRLHFDFDDLNEFSIIQLCLIFQKCPKLVHVSLLGNKTVTAKTLLALYSAVKSSNIYNIDMDYEDLDEELVSRIAFYLMRNMENFLNNNKDELDKSSTSSNKTSLKDEDLIFDGSLLTKAAGHLLENQSNIKGEEKIIIYKSLVEKTLKLRTEIHNSMNRLFKARENRELSIEGKENLLRLCLLDDSLENIIDIFSDEVNITKDFSKLDINDNSKSNRPEMIRRLSSQLTKHHSTQDIMDTGPIINDEYYHNDERPALINDAEQAPHTVVADADSVPVDSTTGKRVFMRSFSQTSIHAKKLEEEEGELHRWGFFVQQQNDIMPDDSQNSDEERERLRLEAEKEKAKQEEELRLRKENEKKTLMIHRIPSGNELRDTIMKAKGIQSISDLIKKVNKDFTTVENIYKHVDAKKHHKEAEQINSFPHQRSPTIEDNTVHDEDAVSDAESIDSYQGQELDHIDADEVYERILDNVIKVRSNKELQ